MLLRDQMEVEGNFLFKFRGELPVILIPPGLYLLYVQITQDTSFDWINTLNYWKWVCFGTIMLGLAIRIYAVGFVPTTTSGRNTHGQVASTVNRTGLYSCVRHPLYLGNFFMALGVAMLSFHFWFVLAYVLLFWIYYERIMYAEEAFISKKFDANAEQWAKVTPTFLPAFRLFTKPDGKFNWRKILRHEKNGVLATFTIIFAYQAMEKFALTGTYQFVFDFWSIGLIAAIVAYLVIRTVAHNSNLLKDPE